MRCEPIVILIKMCAFVGSNCSNTRGSLLALPSFQSLTLNLSLHVDFTNVLRKT